MNEIEKLSFQQNRILSEESEDLNLWNGKKFDELWPSDCDMNNKNEVRKAYNSFISEMKKLREGPVDYSDFNPNYDFAPRKYEVVKDFTAAEKIMGRCPCPDESNYLRCCNLKTLDAVQQCGFACAYCSIQSFYSENQIKVVSDLKEYLEKLNLDENVWHIGTGQSSDSLLLGDDYGTLTALAAFAERYPQTVIELKTKSARTDWIQMNLPRNIVSTWSLNAKTIIEKEEHLTASLEARIKAARKCSESGHLVGFHIHPMVYFKGWEEGYAEVVKLLCDNINPDNVEMIGIGTLTFTKQNLKTLRASKRPTRVTQMQFTPIAGKFSYPLEIKERMFSYLYEQFPSDWKEKVFFYLCMEAPELWKKCLGREYGSNAEFEADMKRAYLQKIHS